mgnify:CR=1 FL=1
MPNGMFVTNELDFEKKIADMKNRQLLEFVARQNYETCIRCEKHDRRIFILENQNKRASGITGGITGTLASIIVAIINYFFVRN